MTASGKKAIVIGVVLASIVVGIVVWRSTRSARPVVAVQAGAGSASSGTRPMGSGARPERGDSNRGGAPEMAVLVDDDPVGGLLLEGQVIDEDDAPVGGATVVLSANPPRTATTEADGSFVFDALVGRPYALLARAKAGVAGPVTVRMTDKTEPVILRLRPASAATVTVVDSAGAPVPSATVEVRGLDVQVATASASGVAEFATVVPGRYDVVAWATGYAKAYMPAQISGETTAVQVVVRKGAPVSGRVVDDKGAPVAETNVVFYGASDWSTQADDRRDAATTDADGRFHFDALAAGSFRLVARHPSHAPGTSEILILDGVTPRDGVTITLAAGATVRGTVVDTAGVPVQGARVRLGEDTRSMISDGPRQAYADAKGAFVIEGLPRRKLRAVAMADAGASEAMPVDATGGDVTGVTLTLDVTGIIAGIVVDPAGEPIEGVQVSAGPSFGGGPGRAGGSGAAPPDFSQWRLRGFPQELTDAGGRFTLTGLAPGNYRVRASRTQRGQRGPRGMQDGTEVVAGTRDVRIVLAPEGGVRGKVAFADGTPPTLVTVSAGPMAEPVNGSGGVFTIDGLVPGELELSVRGPAFDTRSQKVTVVSGKIVDVGTITVERGRVIAGVVLAGDGSPLAGATVFGGRQIFGNGSSSDARMGGGPPMSRGTKQATTDEAGHFELAGFGQGDVTLVAEHDDLGRSTALRLPAAAPGQDAVTLRILPFGSMRGILRQGGQIAEGVVVTAQATLSPGAMYSVASGPDGAYRFDKLAPDTYKVSAMVGMNPMMGMKFYSQDVVVPSGQEVVVDLAVTPGAVALEVTATATNGAIGIVSMWIASGTIAATTAAELDLQLAGAGAGSSAFKIAPFGGMQTFDELVPGAYTVCVVPMPAEVQGMAGMSYFEKHGDTLPVFCKGVTLADGQAKQQVSVSVTMPAFIPDASGSGSGQ